MQAPGKGINDAGSKALKHMQVDVNKSSLERGSLDAVLIASTEMQTPEMGVNNAGPKALAVVQDSGKGSHEAILEASQVMLGDIDVDEVAKAHSSGCSTHNVRLLDPVNDGLLGEKIRKSVMEGLEAPLLDSNAPVMGVDKGQDCKENKRNRVLKQSMQGRKDYWLHHRGELIVPSPKQGLNNYKVSMCPAGLALHHPAAGILSQFATEGSPTTTGKPWTLIQMKEAIDQGLHVSALQPAAMKILAEDVEVKENKGQYKVV